MPPLRDLTAILALLRLSASSAGLAASEEDKRAGLAERNGNVRHAFLLALLLGCVGSCAAQSLHPIDVTRSRVIIRVYKSGLFSAFAHNHEIEAPIVGGQVSLDEPQSVELSFPAARLRVLDPEASPSTRAEIQRTMLGPQVLDAASFPQIRFVSQHVDAAGPDGWRVEGQLTLHGLTKPVSLEVSEAEGVYRGAAVLRLSDFGIRPVRLAGGMVKVKDQVRIEFEIRLENSPTSARVRSVPDELLSASAARH